MSFLTNGSNRRSRIAGSMPAPLSSTVSATQRRGFGDLLHGVTHEGRTTHEAEVAAILGEAREPWYGQSCSTLTTR